MPLTIQGIPDNTSNSACFALLGILSIKDILNKNLLNQFDNMIMDEGSVEYEIAQRQLVMKDPPSDSIFTYFQSILSHYELPSVFALVSYPPSREAWKRLLNCRVHDMVEAAKKADIKSKSSTKYLNLLVLNVGSSHHIWSTIRDNIHDSRRAQIKCKILTSTYILQANRATFNQYSVNPTCKLCCRDPETRQHFVGECTFFEREKSVYIEKLSTSPILADGHISRLKNPDFLTQLTLDVS